MMLNNFTEVQIMKIQETLERLHDCNIRQGSDCKIENIKMFKDDKDNFYMSYVSTSFADGSPNPKIMYIEIDTEGSKIILNDEYKAQENLIAKFETLTAIKL